MKHTTDSPQGQSIVIAAILTVVALALLTIADHRAVYIGLAVVLGLVIVWHRPQLSIILFILSPLFPLTLRDYVFIPLVNEVSVTFIVMLLALLGMSVGRGRPLGWIRLQRELRAPFLMVLLMLLIGAIRSPVLQDITLFRSLATNFLWVALLFSSCMFAYSFFRTNREDTWVYMVAGVFYAIIGSYVVDKLLYGLSDEARAGYLGSSNTVGVTLAISLPLLVVMARQRPHALALKALPYLAVGAVLTAGSRQSVLTLAVYATLWAGSRIGWRWKSATALALALAVLAGILSVQAAASPIETTSIFAIADQATQGRITIWRRAWYEYLSDPIHFWVGGGTNDFLDWNQRTFRRTINTHNHFLLVWVDHGLVGLLLVLWLYGGIFVCAMDTRASPDARARQLANAVLLSLAGLLVTGVFGHARVGARTLSIFWLGVGWLLAERERLARDEQGEAIRE